eukprot:2186740-Prymnesium_polylepis.1
MKDGKPRGGAALLMVARGAACDLAGCERERYTLQHLERSCAHFQPKNRHLHRTCDRDSSGVALRFTIFAPTHPYCLTAVPVPTRDTPHPKPSARDRPLPSPRDRIRA